MTKKLDKPRPVAAPPKDVLLAVSRTEDGEGVRGLRWRKQQPDGVSLTELRPLAEGQPLVHGELVSLSPRPESPSLWDIDVACQVEQGKVVETATDRGGPAQVSSESYREGWELVFGGPPRGRLPRRELN